MTSAMVSSTAGAASTVKAGHAATAAAAMFNRSRCNSSYSYSSSYSISEKAHTTAKTAHATTATASYGSN